MVNFNFIEKCNINIFSVWCNKKQKKMKTKKMKTIIGSSQSKIYKKVREYLPKQLEESHLNIVKNIYHIFY